MLLHVITFEFAGIRNLFNNVKLLVHDIFAIIESV